MINQQLMDQALNMITSLPLQFFKMCCRPPHAKLELILFKKPRYNIARFKQTSKERVRIYHFINQS